jgi:lipoate-protein ligase A
MCEDGPDSPRQPAPVWYLWIDHPRPGFLNMAIDETLLRMAETTGAGFLRLYGWAPACLSFGRHEPALRRYDRDRIVSRHLDVVRRPTGGRAVWHNLDLTYAVAAPSDVFGPLATTHLAIHRTLAEAVEGLGVTASLAPARRPPPVDAGACFATAAGGEVTVANHKVVGSAQLRTRTAFLQHGSILLEGDQRLVSDVAMGPSAPGSAPTLRELVGRPVGFEEMAERVASAARSWAGTWNWIARGDSIVEQAAALADTYRSARWTWCR